MKGNKNKYEVSAKIFSFVILIDASCIQYASQSVIDVKV